MRIAEFAGEKVLKSVNIWHSYGQKGGLCCALSSTSSSVVAAARDNHLLSCNFTKYSYTEIFTDFKKKFTDRLSNRPFLI